MTAAGHTDWCAVVNEPSARPAAMIHFRPARFSGVLTAATIALPKPMNKNVALVVSRLIVIVLGKSLAVADRREERLA